MLMLINRARHALPPGTAPLDRLALPEGPIAKRDAALERLCETIRQHRYTAEEVGILSWCAISLRWDEAFGRRTREAAQAMRDEAEYWNA